LKRAVAYLASAMTLACQWTVAEEPHHDMSRIWPAQTEVATSGLQLAGDSAVDAIHYFQDALMMAPIMEGCGYPSLAQHLKIEEHLIEEVRVRINGYAAQSGITTERDKALLAGATHVALDMYQLGLAHLPWYIERLQAAEKAQLCDFTKPKAEALAAELDRQRTKLKELAKKERS
jgi:hypothetical protein